jgi:hypothetical protein
MKPIRLARKRRRRRNRRTARSLKTEIEKKKKKGGKGKSGKAKGGPDSRYKKIRNMAAEEPGEDVQRFLREAHNISCCLEVDFNGNTTIVLGEEDIEATN